ncbi:MAG: hypothetical protein ACNA8P_08875 [Phycisphaerales bacterium]
MVLVALIATAGFVFGVFALYGYITARLVRAFSDRRISMWWGILVQLLAMVFTAIINVPLFLLIQGPGAFTPAQTNTIVVGDLLASQAMAVPGAVVGLIISLMILAKTNLKESALVSVMFQIVAYVFSALFLIAMAAGLNALSNI